MNTSALVSRANSANLPQWSSGRAVSGGSPGQNPNRQAARLLGALRKFWWVAVLVWILVSVPVGLWVYKTVQPQYVVRGAVKIAPAQASLLDDRQRLTPFYSEFVKTQAMLMKDGNTLKRAAENPQLQSFAWFRKLPDQVNYLTNAVQVEPQAGDTQLIIITATNEDPKAAAALVNAVRDAYLFTVAANENSPNQNLIDNLTRLRNTTQDLIDKTQAQLRSITTDGATFSAEDDRKMMGELLVSARESLGQRQTQRIALASTLAALKASQPVSEDSYKASVAVDGDSQIAAWTQQQVRLQMADEQLKTHHATAEHPERVANREQIAALDARIAARRHELLQQRWTEFQAAADVQRQQKIHQVTADLAGVDQQIAALGAQVKTQDSSIRTINKQLQPVAMLREQLADAKDSFKRYQDRLDELTTESRLQGKISVPGPVYEPRTPEIDKRAKYAAAGSFGGLMLGLAALVLLARLRDRIERAEDLPEEYRPLVIGTVSNAGPDPKGLPGQMRRKVLGEEMRGLHANLLPPGRHQRRVMMVTSPTPGNGKTSIAAHLALSLAKSGLEVLLIDGDLRKRDLTSMFDVGYRPGLAEFLDGQTPELVRPIELLPNFRIMGAGDKLGKNPAELFQRRHFHETLDALSDKFDCVVVDTPPVLVVADARMIAASCDEVLCVLRAGVSAPGDVRDTIEALTRLTGDAPKLIINGVEHGPSYYRYKFSYAEQNGDMPGASAAVAL